MSDSNPLNPNLFVVENECSEKEQHERCVEFLKNHNITLNEDEDIYSFYFGLKPKMKNIIWRMTNGDKTSNTITFQGEFEKFPSYNIWILGLTTVQVGEKRTYDGITHEVWLFWLGYTHLDNLLHIRSQTAGICYMHGPVTLQHYIITMATNGEKSKIMDIGRYEANELFGDALRFFLVEKKGGNSLKFLMKICNLDFEDIDEYTAPNPASKKFESKMQEIITLLKKGSPALVAGFNVYDDFYNNKSNNILCGEPQGSTHKYTHTMVLIGIRKEVTDVSGEERSQYFYLLQNWWKGRHFVEVDAEYMYHCRSNIIFVSKVLTEYGYDKNQLNDISPYVEFSPHAETCIEAEEELLYEESNSIAHKIIPHMDNKFIQ